MAPLAQLAVDLGYEVFGSDASESLSTDILRHKGIRVHIGTDVDFIESVNSQSPLDWFVHSAAIKEDHPERLFVNKNNIQSSKRDKFINFILQQNNLKLIAVAGTHGKTTTTAMLVWMMQQLNLPVSYIIGSNIGFGPAGKHVNGSQYLILETDEYDRNFLSFKPNAAIITSLDYDHQDTYPTIQDYQQAFAQFISSCETLCCAWQDQVKDLHLNQAEFDTKGLKLYFPNKNDAINQEYLSRIQLTGEHNRQNGFLAISLLSFVLKLDSASLNQVLTTFPGTQRRFELIAPNVFSDYAHHPTEIKATLEMATEYKLRHSLNKVIAIYQPHQNIRQHDSIVQSGYRTAFEQADEIYWLPTYLSREDSNLKVLSPTDLINIIDKSHDSKFKVADLDQNLISKLTELQKQNCLILFMGAGSIDTWARKNLVSL
ncbi:MAG: UDP-N-acetylmuramate--L-alanine ligase [Patescibacteria group bacterium]